MQRRRALQVGGAARAEALREDPTWCAAEKREENGAAGAQGAREEGGGE